jgi:hypothetical protein
VCPFDLETAQAVSSDEKERKNERFGVEKEKEFWRTVRYFSFGDVI